MGIKEQPRILNIPGWGTGITELQTTQKTEVARCNKMEDFDMLNTLVGFQNLFKENNSLVLCFMEKFLLKIEAYANVDLL